MMLGKNIRANAVAERIPNGARMAELGVWKGGSSVVFHKKVDYLYLVDSWSSQPYIDSGEFGTKRNYLQRYSKLVGGNTIQDFEKYYENVYTSVVKKFENCSNVKVNRMTTTEFFEWFIINNQEPLDCIYLDASHEYNQVLNDLNGCLKILQIDGLILGDDYGNKPGVKKAVDEFASVHECLLEIFETNQYQLSFY